MRLTRDRTQHQPHRITDEPAQAAEPAATMVHDPLHRIMEEARRRAGPATQNEHWEKGGLDP
jgi:hypothetical protein